MREEKLINLTMKQCILDKWQTKLSYPLNHKDIEELEAIIDYYEQEKQQLKDRIDETINLLCDADSCIMKREPLFKINARILKVKSILKGEINE